MIGRFVRAMNRIRICNILVSRIHGIRIQGAKYQSKTVLKSFCSTIQKRVILNKSLLIVNKGLANRKLISEKKEKFENSLFVLKND